jgi:hypothetical protein
MQHPPAADWLELAKLIRLAPHAVDEVDALLTLYDAERMPIEALKQSLRALAVLH